jgi:glutamate receptor, ionotropic, invertebrate
MYERMYRFMTISQSFVQSAEEGIAKVKAGGYAFILESTTLQYIRNRDCELIQIGDLLDDKGYGIAAPSGSPWISLITNAILKMKTYGELGSLYEKWWEKNNKNKMGECVFNEKNENANELGISQLGGVFYIVGFILFLACVISLLEYSWTILKNSTNKVIFNLREAIFKTMQVQNFDQIIIIVFFSESKS